MRKRARREEDVEEEEDVEVQFRGDADHRAGTSAKAT